MSDGDDLETGGKGNLADHHTLLWAANGFASPFVLGVEIEHGASPSISFGAILGVGYSGRSDPWGARGGVGVSGKGGRGGGAGVVGMAGGTGDPHVAIGAGAKGSGGIGVRGVGGDLTDMVAPSALYDLDVGPGVVGHGGRRERGNTQRKPHGAGVIGMGGSGDSFEPSSFETDGAGVFGQGANAEWREYIEDGKVHPTGPDHPGCGVLGQGGTVDAPMPPAEWHNAAGVIGLAGGYSLPGVYVYSGGSGVYGRGRVGVRGQGNFVCGVLGAGRTREGGPEIPGVIGTSSKLEGHGAQWEDHHVLPYWAIGAGVAGKGSVGVKGFGTGDRGAVFSSDVAPQLHLFPNLANPMKLGVPARAGDLLVTSETDQKSGVETAVLWFCKTGGSGTNAVWVQIA
jgi:hypothetical protein